MNSMNSDKRIKELEIELKKAKEEIERLKKMIDNVASKCYFEAKQGAAMLAKSNLPRGEWTWHKRGYEFGNEILSMLGRETVFLLNRYTGLLGKARNMFRGYFS